MIDRLGTATASIPGLAGLPTAWRGALLLFVALAVFSGLIFYGTVESMVLVWWGTTTYHHGFFVLPISVYLIVQRWDVLEKLTPKFDPMAAGGILAFGVLWLLGDAAEISLIKHIAVVGSLISLFVAVFGRHIAGQIAFPLVFLFFMVPAGDSLIPYLQDFTGHFSVALLRWTGIAVYHDGILIRTESGLFEVAEACAGVRFLIANVVIAALFAYLAYTKWWKWAVFLALSVVIPIIANGFRAYGIMIIAHLTNNELAAGADHLVYGWGFFTLVMFLSLYIGSRFADHAIGDGDGEAASIQLDEPKDRLSSTGSIAVIALALVAFPVYSATVIDNVPQGADGTTAKFARTPTADGWTYVPAEPDSWSPQFVGADAKFFGQYRSDQGEVVDVYMAYYTHQRQGAELIYHANRIFDLGTWKRAGTSTRQVELKSGVYPFTWERTIGPLSHRIAASTYWVGGTITTSTLTTKALQLKNRLFGGDRAVAVIAVSAALPGGKTSDAPQVEDFLQKLEPLPAYFETALAR